MGFLPSKWLEIETIFIEKAGKPDKCNPKTYRPIGLSSSFLKLGEKLINWRIKTTVLKDGIPRQHAFTLNKSTETAVSELVHLLEKAKYNGLKALVISIDIEGAFDNVPFDVISDSLREHGADELIVKWIDYLSRNRNVSATQGGALITFRPRIGTTQGGLNGPDLWIISLWNVIFLEAVKRTSSSTFADDVFSALLGHDLNSIRDLLQTALNDFYDWFKERGLRISPQKTLCMIVNKSKNEPYPKPLTLAGTQIPYVSELKYLGVIIDCNLNWKAHINNRIRKAKRDLLTAKRLVNNAWGLTPERMLWIYESIVRPAVEYCSHVWVPTNSPPQWLVKALDRVQRLALTCVTSCVKSTPTKALERLANVPPLYLHLKGRSAVTVCRIYNAVYKSNWDGISRGDKRGHLFRWKSMLGNKLPPIENIARYNLNTFEVSFDPLFSPQEGICVYTDGSKTNDGVGSGWVICRDDYLISEGYRGLPNHCSVFDAEILAITLALDDLRLCLRGKPNPEKVTFMVDNQAALFTLNSTKITGRLKYNLISELEKATLDLGTKFVFKWVKSHIGTVGNEYADTLAKEATKVALKANIPPSLTHTKAVIAGRVLSEWNRQWNNLTDCRQSRQLISYLPDPGNRAFFLRSTRTKCRNMVALMTGHNNLRYHTFKRIVDTNPNFSPCCRKCGENTETSWHLLYVCPALDTRRREFEYSPDNPKKGPDLKRIYDRAVYLGIMDLIMQRSDLADRVDGHETG